MKRLQWIGSRLRLRNAGGAFIRMLHILRRYGMNSAPMASVLFDFARLARRLHIRPTFPVTAAVVSRHPVLFRKLQDMGCELALHGYRHVDYTALPVQVARRHHEKARHIFQEAGLTGEGFRFPFLRQNALQTKLLLRNGYSWDSSEAVFFSFPRPSKIPSASFHRALRIMATYQAHPWDGITSLPRHVDGLVEIPVALPDDDLLFERMGFSPSQAEAIWFSMFSETHRQGACLTLQLHPERFPLFRRPLENLIRYAQHLRTVWIASLGEIAAWWHRKATFSVSLVPVVGGWRVESIPSESLLLGCHMGYGDPFFGVWHRLPVSCVIPGSKKPLIGLSPKVALPLQKLLADEGFIFDITEDRDAYGVFIGEEDSRDFGGFRQTMERWGALGVPLLRFWRWPFPFQSCLSVTGDIDGIELWDYLTRYAGD